MTRCGCTIKADGLVYCPEAHRLFLAVVDRASERKSDGLWTRVRDTRDAFVRHMAEAVLLDVVDQIRDEVRREIDAEPF